MSYTGIATIVDQLTGRSRIPESAKPRDDAKPGPRPGAFPARTDSALARLLASGDGRWRGVEATAKHAGVSQSFIRRAAPDLVRAGMYAERTVRRTNGVRVEYRSVR